MTGRGEARTARAPQSSGTRDYTVLRPTYAIWLLAENLFPNDTDYARNFQFRDNRGRTALEAHGGIWLLELDKFAVQRIGTERQRWLKFFKEGEQLDEAALAEVERLKALLAEK